MAAATWDDDAACRGLDTDLWFSRDVEGIAAARAVCARCLVRAECLAYALEHNIDGGIWGGRTEDERRILRRAASRRAA